MFTLLYVRAVTLIVKDFGALLQELPLKPRNVQEHVSMRLTYARTDSVRTRVVSCHGRLHDSCESSIRSWRYKIYLISPWLDRGVGIDLEYL